MEPEFDINDWDDYTAKELRAIYEYMGWQVDQLNAQKEIFSDARLAVIMRVHELETFEDENDSDA